MSGKVSILYILRKVNAQRKSGRVKVCQHCKQSHHHYTANGPQKNLQAPHDQGLLMVNTGKYSPANC